MSWLLIFYKNSYIMDSVGKKTIKNYSKFTKMDNYGEFVGGLYV